MKYGNSMYTLYFSLACQTNFTYLHSNTIGKLFPSTVTVMPSCQQASASTASRSQQLQDITSETQVTTNTDATAQGVVEVIVHPGYEAEFDRMATLHGTLIHNVVPLIKAAIPFVDDLKTY
ncbi:PREDICTED: uncharacterized protein LOC109583971, partial [Amphimedon queenslandica]|uniref:Uncharacterized protein n=1 Tax=Amphimedon queenslandica TaxID=400682 RepID=A0AAN0JDJ9_AMPQE